MDQPAGRLVGVCAFVKGLSIGRGSPSQEGLMVEGW